ncbi:hypothetical protein CapIbe_023354 [Capra ibex]
MKRVLLPVLALWVGCCPGGALAKQVLGPRGPGVRPTPTGLPTLQPPPPSASGPPDGLVQRESKQIHPEAAHLMTPMSVPCRATRDP